MATKLLLLVLFCLVLDICVSTTTSGSDFSESSTITPTSNANNTSSSTYVPGSSESDEDEAFDLDMGMVTGITTIMRGIRNMMPREELNISMSDSDFSEALIAHGMSLIPIAIPGLAFFVLALLGLFIYLPIYCCCLSNRGAKKDPKDRSKLSIWLPVSFWVFFNLFVIFGAIVGHIGNTGFTGGITRINVAVMDTSDHITMLGDNITDVLQVVSTELPQAVLDLKNLMAGIPEVTNTVISFQDQLRNASSQLEILRLRCNELQGGTPNTEAFTADVTRALTESMNSLNETVGLVQEVEDTLGDMKEDTDTALTDAANTISEQTGDIQNMVDDTFTTVNDLTDQIGTIGDSVEIYNSYIMAFFAVFFCLPFGMIALVVLGILFKFRLCFCCNICCTLIFICIWFFFGSLLFMMGIIMEDACLIIDNFSPPSPADDVLEGCGSGESLFDILGQDTSFNMTEMMDFDGQIEDFKEYMEDTFNADTVAQFFDRCVSSLLLIINLHHKEMNNVTGYNLTAEAENVTAESVGESEADLALAVNSSLTLLNALTGPHGDIFNKTDYTTLVITNYPVPQQADISDAWNFVNISVSAQIEVQLLIEELQTNLTEIEALRADLEYYSNYTITPTYDQLQNMMDDFVENNLTAVEDVVVLAEGVINSILALGECSFVSEGVTNILDGFCVTWFAGLDGIALSLWILGLFSVPSICIVGICFPPRFRKHKDSNNPKEAKGNQVAPSEYTSDDDSQ